MADRKTARMAPVQGYFGIPAGRVPWAVHALAAEEYNKHHSQSADRVAQRGGFDWIELVAALRGDYSLDGVERARADLARCSREAARDD